MAVADEAVHRRAVGELDVEDLRARVGVRVEVDEPDRAVPCCDRAHVRLRDRVVASEDHGQGARGDDLADGQLDLRVRADGVGRDDRGVPEVDDAQLGEGVDLGLEVRPRWAARGADGARSEARARAIGDEVVGRRADDRHVDSGELGGVLRVRHARVREEPRVVRLVGEPELAPALERVDHGLAGLDDRVRLLSDRHLGDPSGSPGTVARG